MTMLASVTDFHIVLAIHVLTIVLTFGVTLIRPLVFALAARQDPRVLPTLYRVEHRLERLLVGPGMALVVLSGIYLASWERRWDSFYVWWGISVIAIIAATGGTIMMPLAARAAALAERDLGASASALSSEYRLTTRRMNTVGALLSVLVLATVLFMGVEVR